MEQHNHIGTKLKALSTAITQEINRGTAELGLTGSQSFFLGYLVRHRDRTVYPRDLEREFDFSHPTVSGILQRLQTKGFVTFQPGETDRRCKQVLVTDKAVECHAAVMRQIAQTEARAVAGMQPEEIQELDRLLGMMMNNMGVSLCRRQPRTEEENL